MNTLTLETLARLALSVVLIYLSICDLRRGRVPNAVVLPLMVLSLGALVWRLAAGQLGWGAVGIVVASWAVGLTLWSLRVFGAGDVKLALTLVGLLPDLRLVLILLGVLLVGLPIILAWQEGTAGFKRLQTLFVTAAGGSLPTRAEIQAAYQRRPSRVTALIGSVGILGVWLLP